MLPIAPIALLLLVMNRPGGGQSEARADLATYLRETAGLTDYKSASTDLSGDGSDETIILATQADFCGSGGCVMLILSPAGRSYRVVTRTTVTRAPIRMLASSSYGWRDISVMIGGGGVRWQEVRLRFDGRRYPTNPTVIPAIPVSQTAGRILIDED